MAGTALSATLSFLGRVFQRCQFGSLLSQQTHEHLPLRFNVFSGQLLLIVFDVETSNGFVHRASLIQRSSILARLRFRLAPHTLETVLTLRGDTFPHARDRKSVV